MATFRSTTTTNTGSTVKTTGANLLGVNIINLHSAAIFVKFYNSDVATFQDAPVLTLQVAANSYLTLISPSSQRPLAGTSDGLTVRVVTGGTDSNNTAAATLPVIELDYN